MAASATNTYSGTNVLQPYCDADLARTRAVKLPASIDYAAGTVLGELVGNNEVQTVAITGDPTGGTFTLTFGGDTTANIDFDATAAELQAALEALDTIETSNVSVTKARSIWNLTTAAGADAGTFRIEVIRNGVSATTSALAYNVSTTDMQTALVALSTVGTGGVAVTGSAGSAYRLGFLASLGDLEVRILEDSVIDSPVWEGGYYAAASDVGTYQVTFQNALGYQNVAAMTANAAGFTGGTTPGVTIATLTAGSAGTPGTFKAYTASATDGSQTARAILQFAATTDSDGKITTIGGEKGETRSTVPAFVRGTFACSDLTGLTEAAVAQLGRLTAGTVAAGLLQVG